MSDARIHVTLDRGQAAYDDEPCPARGPGLNHIQDGSPRCVECGITTYHREGAWPAPAEPSAPADAPEPCRCSMCRQGRISTEEERARHAERHEEFHRYLLAAREREFTPPDAVTVLRRQAEEYSADRLCRLPHHRGLPAHNASHS